VITEEESTHSPVLVRERVDDLQPGSNNALMDCIDLDGSRHTNADGRVARRRGIACDHLELHGRCVCGTEISDPTKIHADAELEDLRVQLVGSSNIGDRQVGNDPGDADGLNLRQSAQPLRRRGAGMALTGAPSGDPFTKTVGPATRAGGDHRWSFVCGR